MRSKGRGINKFNLEIPCVGFTERGTGGWRGDLDPDKSERPSEDATVALSGDATAEIKGEPT